MNILDNWQPCEVPAPKELTGKLVQLTHFNFDEHTVDLWKALGGEKANELIRFFPNGPYETPTEFGNWLRDVNESNSFHTMIISSLKTQEILGMASYMRCAPEHGSVEIGAIAHGPKMMRSPRATEVHYILAKHIFDDLGYRRYEWKLNNENQVSHNAAKRLGFTFEGVFRQHMVAKGKNRDTAWYSMLDSEWPLKREAFETWLDSGNFDISGTQIKSLKEIRRELSE